MIDSLPPAVRMTVRARAQIASLVFGLSLLMAVGLLGRMPLGQACFLAQIVLTLCSATLAGFVATLLIPWNDIPRMRSLGVGGRIGLKTGSTTALMGGAALCVAAFVRARLCDYADEESAAKARLWVTWLVALAGVLPSVCVGFIGGSLAALICRPILPEGVHQRSTEEIAVSDPAWLKWLGRGVAWISVLGLLLPLSGLALQSKPPRPSPPASLTQPAPAFTPPPPPPWTYTRPDGLAEASPALFMIVARRALPDSIPGAPLSISPDGNWLAYAPANEAVVARVDLNTALIVQNYPSQSTPAALSWSPDSKRLLILSQHPEQGARLHVAETGSASVIALPRPKDRDLPHGPMHWAFEKEAVFFPDDEPSLFYDLDQLRLHPLASKDTYHPTANWTAEQKLTFPSTELPSLMRTAKVG